MKDKINMGIDTKYLFNSQFMFYLKKQKKQKQSTALDPI